MFEMNDEQKALFDVLTTLQQEIALSSLSGMNDINSYKASSGKASTVKAMEASVSQILGNHKVARFLDSMKAVVVNDAIMTRVEMLESLTKLATLSGEDLERGVGSITGLKGGFDVKMKAMDMISKLEGWESASKHDHTSSDGSMSPNGRKLDDFYSDSNV